jgi:hypothetical protein
MSSCVLVHHLSLTQASREDREAIDRFTTTLSEAMSPLIIQVNEESHDDYYDVLASVYLRFDQARPAGSIHDDLIKLAAATNQIERHKDVLQGIKNYVYALKKKGIADAVYFPDLILSNRVLLFIMLLMKGIWLIAGGWLWRVARHLVFSKIKANTFKSPVSVGAAMVLFPLVSILLLITCLLAGWPLWIVPLWMFVMFCGKFFRPSFLLVWRLFTLSFKAKANLSKDVRFFRKAVAELVG